MSTVLSNLLRPNLRHKALEFHMKPKGRVKWSSSFDVGRVHVTLPKGIKASLQGSKVLLKGVKDYCEGWYTVSIRFVADRGTKVRLNRRAGSSVVWGECEVSREPLTLLVPPAGKTASLELHLPGGGKTSLEFYLS